MVQDLDGLVLVHNSETSNEPELERMYKIFGQRHLLTRGQCAVFAVNTSGGFSSGKGLGGRLKALQQHAIDINLKSPQTSAPHIKGFVDLLVGRCIERKSHKIEEEVAGVDASER
jgi:hypothetical protein